MRRETEWPVKKVLDWLFKGTKAEQYGDEDPCKGSSCGACNECLGI